MTLAIQTKKLTKIFSNRLIAVNNLNLEVEEGSVFGFLGPNGAGKTTTIRQLLGLISPTAGEVRIFGERMTPNSSNLRRRIGYLSTNPRFPPKMTPITYLDFVGRLFCLSKSTRTSRLSALIRSVGLLPAASQQIKGFSTGMITRLGLAAALMNEPELLILDEPTSGLDPVGRKSTLDLIDELDKEKTIVVSSHILSDIERICTHVGIINEGKLIFSGSVKEMKKHIQSSTFKVELEGNAEGLHKRIESLDGVAEAKEHGEFTITVSLMPGASPVSVLRGILHIIEEANLDIISISSAVSSIEDAFLKFIEEEESLGFLRAFRG